MNLGKLVFAQITRRSQHGLICDQTIVLTGFYSRQDFDTPPRRIRFKDPETGKRLVFLTNNFALPAITITKLYRCRWWVELFFKWIKQHLRIKVFFGTSENAVKTQLWIAISVYVHVAIVKKRLNLSASLYEMLQILSLTMFERIPLDQLLNGIITNDVQSLDANQLNHSVNVRALLKSLRDPRAPGTVGSKHDDHQANLVRPEKRPAHCSR